MERVGILIVAYGSRETAMIDVLDRSREYRVDLYVVDRQRNPFNVKRSKEHVVVPSLSIEDICKFTKTRRDKIDLGIVGPEKPIIAGVRDLVEKETHVPIICPSKEYAIEGSKVAQRLLFQDIVPEVNPRFQVFDPKEYRNQSTLKKCLYRWLDELDNKVAVKPDAPAAGKGVGVWGDHFNTREQLFEHFLANFNEGPVIVEEKLEGEESSFQAFCDGRHLVPMPETRDYKRAFNNDQGPNTGGMGSYKAKNAYLPFMRQTDWDEEKRVVERIFDKLKGAGQNPGLRGVPFYEAFIHTSRGPMILETNSRPGDPEIITILPLLKDDLVDICFKMIEGTLLHVDIEEKASVITYKVPPSYGEYSQVFPKNVAQNELNTPVILEKAEKLSSKYKDGIRIYPASMELRGDGKSYALSSRTVGVVGVADDIQSAREISLEGISAVEGGALWNRSDIASKEHIEKSVKHMEQLRRLK